MGRRNPRVGQVFTWSKREGHTFFHNAEGGRGQETSARFLRKFRSGVIMWLLTFFSIPRRRELEGGRYTHLDSVTEHSALTEHSVFTLGQPLKFNCPVSYSCNKPCQKVN